MKSYLTSAAAVLLRISAAISEQSTAPVGINGMLDAKAAIAIEDDQQQPYEHGTEIKAVHLRGKTKSNENTHIREKDQSPSFGTSLFKEVCDTFPTGNVLLSPISVYTALLLIEDGATEGSENERELEELLVASSLMEQIENVGGNESDVQLTMANSVWSNMLKQSYVDEVASNRAADAFPMPKNWTDVNTWIEENTNGMIKDFLGDDSIPGNIMTLLVNAVYFKGIWSEEFDPEDTIDGEFTLYDESKVPARFMTATRKMKFIADAYDLGRAKLVILDYCEKEDGQFTEFTSLFILPATPDADSMNDVVAGLSTSPIQWLLEDAYETNVALKLPRFRLEFGPESFKPALENMGMNVAFNQKVQHKFDRMSNDSTLTVDDVLHGAVIEVTEQGTEGSGTTVVPMNRRSRPRPPPEMTFDHPFVVAVIHRETGTPVFIGRVEEPDLVF
eukprot:CAMPEP_0183719186 /NCGR_PEP_ID=MMETSP0737-20130205/12242_1 /TAXON_ID=385413 /ORGANISM="Thalassiosira miniscula, Strain CCMP1093" /LENGTH=446 /DNA_ID=CAMNT_0025948897 /DNA_START=54 /DNA_END=1394 /DNA_ORIENTATION=+